MHNLSNWNYLYKIIKGNGYENWPTNMMYTPLLSPDNSIMCMAWDEKSEYQSSNKKLSTELINFFFEREVTHLTQFQGNSWAPRLLDINYPDRKIFIEWNGKLLNHIIFKDLDLNLEFPNWKIEVQEIVRNIYNLGYYKNALYPHCFFIGEDKKLKTIDFYSCVSIQERYLPYEKLEGMIGDKSVDRFMQAKHGEMIDFKIFFENTVKTHMPKTWPDNPFEDYYEK